MNSIQRQVLPPRLRQDIFHVYTVLVKMLGSMSCGFIAVLISSGVYDYFDHIAHVQAEAILRTEVALVHNERRLSYCLEDPQFEPAYCVIDFFEIQ